MPKNTNEDSQIIEEKLKYVGLDLDKIPPSLLNVQKIRYRPLKSYEDNNYKVYKYVDVKDIEILITPLDRLDDLNDKFIRALPLAAYLNSESYDTIEQYATFLEMIKNLDLDKLEDIEKEQKELNKNIPYEIKYRDNFIWQVYYSEVDNKYFMLYSSNENHSEALFYLIKKKLQKKNEKIYIPISHLEYSSNYLKKSEISDLENYLWFFTKEWPNIYEVYDKDGKQKIEILGKTNVYDDLKSMYKISLKDKKDVEEMFKLIKALFILQSNEGMEYDFKPIINQYGSLDFCYNLKKITYKTLSEFIRQEVELKQDRIDELYNNNIILFDNLELLKQTVEKQKVEYLNKEKQITNYIECKKSFFGKVRYFFKKGKKIKNINDEKEDNKQNNKKVDKGKKNKQQNDDNDNANKLEDNNKNIFKKFERIEKKDMYTIEDLLKVCDKLKETEIQYKNMQMDIKALENKKESLDKKIKNATLYINEIESHKKSIFEFWKFTNKDENNLLMQGDEETEETNNKLRKVFVFENDIESLGEKVDSRQRNIFTQNECDAIFAIRSDISSFNILRKKKVLKKDDAVIEKGLKELKKEYVKNLDIINKKDFDIFGNVAEDKTKIKILKNNKHREIEKDKFKILGIRKDTDLEDYKDNIKNYKTLLDEAYGKMTSSYDISVYKASNEELNEKGYEILDINPKNEIIKKFDSDKINLYKLNIKENSPIMFYSNIMFFDNLYKTLPVGMDLQTEVLIDLNQFDMKLVSRKDFNMNLLSDEYENKIQLFQVYEYDLERREEKDD